MQSPASSTICGTHGARRNVKSCSEVTTCTFGKNGTHRLKIPFMVRRNGSIPNYRNAAGLERAVSLYDGKAFRKEPDDSKVLVCEECGSRQVETQAWIDANTEMYICDTAHDCDGKWCEECEENVDFCSLEEFKQIMQSWWTGNDIRTLEGITGLKETDYLSNNSSQTFAGATDKWWYNLDYDGKRNVYNKHTSNNE